MSAEVIPMQSSRRPVVSVLAIPVVAIGIVVLYGWLTGNRALIEMSESVAMVVNTAVTLVLAGLGIVLLASRNNLAALLVGQLVCVLGWFTGLQYLIGVDLGIDTLLFDPGALIESRHPGRMSPTTAGCAFLSGLTISILALPGRLPYEGYVAGVLGAVVLAIGATTGAAYSLSFRNVYEWATYPGMAQLTATGFALLGTALLAISWERVDTKVGAWRFSLLALAAALMTLNGLIWAAFQSAGVERGQKFVDVQMATLEQGAVERMDLVVDSLEKMSRRLSAAPEPTVSAWSARVQGFTDSNPAVVAIAMVDADGIVYRSEGRELLEPVDWSAVLAMFGGQGTKEATVGGESVQSTTQIIPWTSSGQIQRGVKVQVTFRRAENGIQHMVALIDLDALLGTFVQRQSSVFSQVQIEMDGTGVFFASSSADDVGRPVVRAQRPFLDRVLRFEATVAADPIPYRSFLPAVVLAMGLGLSALLLFTLDLLMRARLHGRQLADHDRFLAQVFDSAPSALILVDAQGRIEMANEHCLSLFGYSRGELKERRIEDLMPDRMREAHKGMRADYLKEPSPRDMGDGRELLGRRRDGREFPVEVGLRPVYRADGMRVLASVVDVTEHRRIVSELTRSNEELDRFAYIASHDLKSPLRAIDQLATWLADDLGESLAEESSRHLDLMRSRVGRMERLLSDLLDYSRIGREASQPEWIDLEALIRNCFAMYNADERFRLNLEGPMPSLKSVRTSLEMVFRNLLGNAIKHHDRPSGEITVRVTKSGPMVLFEIADDGPGVPQQYAKRAFEMFSTLRPRDEIEGSGMGLAIVKKTIATRGGKISLHANKPRGLLVRFSILDIGAVAKAAHDAAVSA